jgi:hypothetical protein
MDLPFSISWVNPFKAHRHLSPEVVIDSCARCNLKDFDHCNTQHAVSWSGTVTLSSGIMNAHLDDRTFQKVNDKQGRLVGSRVKILTLPAGSVTTSI